MSLLVIHLQEQNTTKLGGGLQKLDDTCQIYLNQRPEQYSSLFIPQPTTGYMEPFHPHSTPLDTWRHNQDTTDCHQKPGEWGTPEQDCLAGTKFNSTKVDMYSSKC